jgi:hypothetical protein
VRVIRYRQYKPHGTVCEAYGLTDVPRHRVSSRSLLGMAKSRWEIEKQGFNDAKNRYGLEPICHQERHSLLAGWLLTCLALTIERLYRVRYLHRGTHPLRAAIDLLLQLQLSLGRPVVSALDSSGELASRAGGALRFSLLALLPQLSVAVSTHRGKMSLENTCRWAVPRRSALICAPSRNSAVPYAQIPKPLSPLRVGCAT